MRALMGVMVASMTTLGCAPKPPATMAVIEEKIYTVTPDQVKVIAGIVNGEMTQMKVIERVEKGSGRVDTPARLSGQLKLTNGSLDQTVRLVGAKILYLDDRGQPIKIEEARTEPVLKFQTSYNAPDRLDPGQHTTQSVEVDFPAAALQAKKLKEIRIELVYLPSPYKLQTANFAVSIGGQPLSKNQ